MSFCLLVKDFKSIFKEQRKYALIYILIVLSFSLYYLFIISINPIECYKNALGLDFNFNKNILVMIMFFIHFFVAIYIQIYLLVNDIRFGFSNLLLRVNLKKWFLARFISNSIVIITIRTILHIILFIIIFILFRGRINFNEMISYWFMDCIYFILIQNVGLLFYLLFYLSKKILIVLFFLVIAFFSYIPLYVFDYVLYILLAVVVLQFINYFIFKKVYIKILEEEI